MKKRKTLIFIILFLSLILITIAIFKYNFDYNNQEKIIFKDNFNLSNHEEIIDLLKKQNLELPDEYSCSYSNSQGHHSRYIDYFQATIKNETIFNFSIYDYNEPMGAEFDLKVCTATFNEKENNCKCEIKISSYNETNREVCNSSEFLEEYTKEIPITSPQMYQKAINITKNWNNTIKKIVELNEECYFYSTKEYINDAFYNEYEICFKNSLLISYTEHYITYRSSDTEVWKCYM